MSKKYKFKPEVSVFRNFCEANLPSFIKLLPIDKEVNWQEKMLLVHIRLGKSKNLDILFSLFVMANNK